MSNEKQNYILNLFGTDVDFSAIATDDVPELDISDEIWEEKLSFLMLWKNPAGLSVYNGRPTENINPCDECERSFQNSAWEYIPECRNAKGQTKGGYVVPCERKKEFDCKYEEKSYFAYSEGDCRNRESYICEDEGIPLKEQCAYGKLPHYDRKLREYFKESGENSPEEIEDANLCHDRISEKYCDHFYPKQTGWRPPWHPSSGDLARLPLSFRFNRESGVGDGFVLKLYATAGHEFVKAYYPVSLVQLPEKPLSNGQYVLPHRLWAKIPREDRQHLLHLDKIVDAKIVVICMALEDAWALQNKNKKSDVVFTSFKCDNGRFEQVDFSALERKDVVLLISNGNGCTLAESYLDAEKLVSYLESKEKTKLSSISFIQREIVYPSHDGVWSYPDLLDLYKEQRPTIKNDSFIYYKKEQFEDYIKLAKAEIARKETAAVDFPFYLPQDEKSVPGSEDDSEEGDRLKNMLVRPLIAKGDISLVCGPSKSGKSIFTMMLCGLFASSSHKSLIDGMAFTRCFRKEDRKKTLYSVYVAFDNNITKDYNGYRKKFVEKNFGKSERFKFLNMAPQASDCFKNHSVLVEKINEIVGGNEVGLIVIDSLYALARDKYMSAVNDYSVKLFTSFPNAAVLWIHHSNEGGDPAGGERIKSAATFWFDFSAVPEDEDKRIIRLGGNYHFLKAEKVATVQIDKDGFKLIEPPRSEDDMRLLVYNAYISKEGDYGLKADDAAKLLGYADASGIRHLKDEDKKDGQEPQQ